MHSLVSLNYDVKHALAAKFSPVHYIIKKAFIKNDNTEC